MAGRAGEGDRWAERVGGSRTGYHDGVARTRAGGARPPPTRRRAGCGHHRPTQPAAGPMGPGMSDPQTTRSEWGNAENFQVSGFLRLCPLVHQTQKGACIAMPAALIRHPNAVQRPLPIYTAPRQPQRGTDELCSAHLYAPSVRIGRQSRARPAGGGAHRWAEQGATLPGGAHRWAERGATGGWCA